ncbi:hypothetical protein NC651_027379 [Populus alba x Populus x berolinensis]|nr:hypothetical protein NC651_027379 [Populus alba x Populus x berolinensis]
MCLSTGEADAFNKYKDDKGNFKENLTKDVKGLLSLYEASYLSVHGEIILDEALVFTETHLKSMVARLVSPLADQVTRALNQPLHGGIVKYGQWYSISFYEQDELHIEPALKPAKSNFNMLQKLYVPGGAEKSLQVFLNFGRAANIFYSDYDAFTESRTMIKRFGILTECNSFPYPLQNCLRSKDFHG